MAEHNRALDAAIVAAGLDPRNELVRKSSQALVEKYIEARNGEAEPVYWMANDGTRDLIGHEGKINPTWEGQTWRDRYTIPLFAAPVSAGGEKVKVKQLKWRVPSAYGPKDPDPEDIALCADGIAGIYGISRKQSVGMERLLWWTEDPFTWTGYASVNEAKAAAQRDYETRILSALETRDAK
jgi:hypothetical protein